MIHYGSEALEIHWRIMEPFLVVRFSSPLLLLLRKTFIFLLSLFGKDRLKLPPKKKAKNFFPRLYLLFFKGREGRKTFASLSL